MRCLLGPASGIALPGSFRWIILLYQLHQLDAMQLADSGEGSIYSCRWMSLTDLWLVHSILVGLENTRYGIMGIRNLIFSLAAGFMLFSGSVGAWTINDSYDNQQDGQVCGVFEPSAKDSYVSSENSSSGSKSCKMRITQGGLGWGGRFDFPAPLQRGDEIWMRFRIFMPAGFDYGVYSQGDSLKFVRFNTRNSSGGSAYWDWQLRREGTLPSHGIIMELDNCTDYFDCWQLIGDANDAPTHGTWETWEVYVKFDTIPGDSGGQARTRIWKNGLLIDDANRRRTLTNNTDTIDAGLLFSYWNGGAPRTQHLYFDDLVVTSDRPSNTDSQGHPYIGMGNFVTVAPPLPPSGIH